MFKIVFCSISIVSITLKIAWIFLTQKIILHRDIFDVAKRHICNTSKIFVTASVSHVISYLRRWTWLYASKYLSIHTYIPFFFMHYTYLFFVIFRDKRIKKHSTRPYKTAGEKRTAEGERTGINNGRFAYYIVGNSII